MKALITGINGFIGSALQAFLREKGIDIIGFSLSPSRLKGLTVYQGDVRSFEKVHDVLSDTRPDLVFHLAGKNRESSDEIQALHEVNYLGTFNIVESLLRLRLAPRLFVPSSSAVYGITPSGEKISETSPLLPINHYGVSKAAQELLVLSYFQRHQADVVITRNFNLVGPSQSSDFVCGKVIRQMVEIERGQRRVLELGNLDPVRDFCNLRDAVRAYWLLMEKGESGEVYNVCSGEGLSIRELIVRLAHVTGKEVEVEPRWPGRGVEIPCQTGSFEKIHRQTGWRPTIPIEESLQVMLEEARR